MTTNSNGNYAQVNGINLYYELHGQGEPLVLLHGGLGAIEMFGGLLPQLAAGRQVIGVDLQAHGRTADVDRPMTFETMADDIAGLLQHLGLSKADVLGYSLGGGVALRTAIRHPQLVRKLILISTPCKRNGWYPEVLVGMAQMGAAAAEPMKQTPIYDLYAKIAPRLEDWPVLLTKVGELLKQDYDWSASVSALKLPVLIIAGDADSISPAHAAEFFQLLGGGKVDGSWDGSGMTNSRLAILPATTHFTPLEYPGLAGMITQFLDFVL